MTAYLVANYDVVDPDAFREYQMSSSPIMSGGARLLVVDAASHVKEGDAGHQTVVIEYPTKEAALAAYESDEYQAVVGMRHGSTTNGGRSSSTGSTLGDQSSPPAHQLSNRGLMADQTNSTIGPDGGTT